MKKKARILVAGCTALMLTAAATMLLLLRNREEKNQTEPSEIGLHLTAQVDHPAERGVATCWENVTDGIICEKPFGYYFTGTYVQMKEGDLRFQEAVCYADKEEDISLPLCPRPNCIHDGNDFCTATTSAYTDHTMLIAEGDYLYCLAKKGKKTAVLRYAADGTEITEIGYFDRNPDFNGRADIVGNPMIHRGYLWCIISARNVNDNALGVQSCGGFTIAGCELATGKTVTLLEQYPDDPNSTTYFQAPEELMGDGDYLYVNMHAMNAYGYGNDKCKVLPQGVSRISLVTGEVEFVDSHGAVCVSDGICYYMSYNRQHADLTDIYGRNMETGAVESLATFEKMGDGGVIADGQYVYLYVQGDDGTGRVMVYDHRHHLVADEELPRMWIRNIAAKDGMLYVAVYAGDTENEKKVEEYVMGISVADCAAGHGTWQRVYDTMLLTPDAAEAYAEKYW